MIVGRLIPAGTGFVHHQERRAKRVDSVMQAAEAALSAELNEVETETETSTEE